MAKITVRLTPGSVLAIAVGALGWLAGSRDLPGQQSTLVRGLQDTVSWKGKSVRLRQIQGVPYLYAFLADAPHADSARLVIRDQSGIDSLWNAMTVNGRWHPPGPRPTTIDFAHDMALVASDGRHHSGYRVAFQGAAERNDTLFVLVTSTGNIFPDCTEDALYSPVAVALVPRTRATIVFIARKTNHNCDGSYTEDSARRSGGIP